MLQSASPVVAYNWFLYIVTISSTQATQTCSFLHSTTRTTLCLTRPCAHLTSALNHCTAQNTHTLHAEIYFPVHVLMPVWLVCEFGFLSTLSQLSNRTRRKPYAYLFENNQGPINPWVSLGTCMPEPWDCCLCAARVCRFSNTLRQSPATPNLYIGIHKLAPSSVNVGKGFPKFAPPGVHFGTAGRKLTPAEPISDKKGVISDKKGVISPTQFPSDRCRGARFGKRVPTDRCTRRLFLQSCPVVHWAAAVSRISNSVACVKIRLHVIGLCSSSWSSVFRVVAFCFSCAREQFPEIAG